MIDWLIDWLIDWYYLRCILSSVPDISTELGRVELGALLVELETVEGNIDNLTTIKHLQLKTMGTIRFQVQVSNLHTILIRIFFYQTFLHYNSILVAQYFFLWKIAFLKIKIRFLSAGEFLITIIDVFTSINAIFNLTDFYYLSRIYLILLTIINYQSSTIWPQWLFLTI